ncbi:MAG: hypothetical protein IJ316_00725 [Clostridia bacterium]|nr:hypothetical protein [Clostridia bacterium]
MRIIVKSGENTNIKLSVPTAVVVNSFTAMFIPKVLEPHGVKITKKQSVKFMKALNKYRHNHEDWTLVEVNSSNGDCVKIEV